MPLPDVRRLSAVDLNQKRQERPSIICKVNLTERALAIKVGKDVECPS